MPVSLLGMLMVAQPSWLFGSAAAATSTLGVAAGILQVGCGEVWGRQRPKMAFSGDSIHR